MKLQFTSRAAQDLVAIADYLNARNPHAARHVRATILRSLHTPPRDLGPVSCAHPAGLDIFANRSTSLRATGSRECAPGVRSNPVKPMQAGLRLRKGSSQ